MQMKVVHKNSQKPVDNGKNKQAGIFKRLLEYLQDMRENKFTGYIKINYTQGSIGRIERFEEILKK
jgi:hypothetical protein